MKAKLRQQDVAEAMDWSLSKLIRLESSGKVATSDLRALLQHCNITDPEEIDRFVAMARASKEEGWWSKYRDATSTEFLTFLGYEDVLYLENSRGDMVSRDRQEDLVSYREAFEQLRALAGMVNFDEVVDTALKGMSD